MSMWAGPLTRMACATVPNAKMRRTGICGAAETLLVDEDGADRLLQPLVKALLDGAWEVRGDAATRAVDARVREATETDWHTEYLDAVISVKLVAGVRGAMEHIAKYGSQHTEAIATRRTPPRRRPSCARWRPRLRCNPFQRSSPTAGEFCTGAEIGIATGRFHARGPVGVEQLTTFKYAVRGNLHPGLDHAEARMSAPSPAPADLRPPPVFAGTRIGLLGGSFNPPHTAHRLISLTALKRLALHQEFLDRDAGQSAQGAWRAAAARSPHRIVLGGFEPPAHQGDGLRGQHRHRLYRNAEKSFAAGFPGVQFVWLMGADNLASFHRWKEWETIFRRMPIAVEDRPAWRYRALSSPAASRFARSRIPETHAAALPSLAAPAWCYLSGPLSKLSSTALRAGQAEAGR